MKLAATGYIIPFMFVYGPSLLLVGEPIWVATSCITSVIGVTCLAAGLHGYFVRRATMVDRLLLIADAFALIKPGIGTDLLGAGLIAAAVTVQLVAGRRMQAAVAD